MASEQARTALVTGAGQGVGAEIAAALDRAGHRVLVNDLDGDRAARTAEGLSRGVAAVADVTDAAAMRGLVDEHGPVDVLVNNAGNAGPAGAGLMGPFADSKPDDWEPWIRVNFYGVLYSTHAVLPGMVERGFGRIVTIISDAARVGEPQQSVYAGAKAAAAGFIRSVAKEVAAQGVTANCVSLGAIQFHRDDRDPPDPERLARMARRYPAGRLGTPEDVAGLVAFLASDAAGWITAQTYPVNGGYSATL